MAIKAFQSTPLREGRRRCVLGGAGRGAFQSTPLREGRPLQNTAFISGFTFQSTPLREGRHYSFFFNFFELCFNPRPYVRGDEEFLEQAVCTDGFNPRPYVRGDLAKAPPTNIL